MLVPKYSAQQKEEVGFIRKSAEPEQFLRTTSGRCIFWQESLAIPRLSTELGSTPRSFFMHDILPRQYLSPILSGGRTALSDDFLRILRSNNTFL